MEVKLIKVLEHYHLYNGDKAIATTIVGNPMLLPNLSLKNCEAIERGYDLGELAMGYDLYENINFVGQTRAYKAGFQKALSILGDKKFSEKDVISMIEKSRETGLTAEYLILNNQQTEWDVVIVTKPFVSVSLIIVDFSEDTPVDVLNVKKEVVEEGYALDEDGCLILRKI